MTPAELVEAGQALWGDAWRQRMPVELGVGIPTVWKWAAGKHPVPEWAVRFLRLLAAQGRFVA